jgi:adenosine deaminase
VDPPTGLPAAHAGAIAAAPKTEHHLHLEGALPYDVLHQWQPSRVPADPPFRAPGFRFASFEQFDTTLLGHATAWFTTAERYHEAARIVLSRLAAQQVRYVELSFHLPIAPLIGVPAREILDAITAAASGDIELRVFAAMRRDSYNSPLQATIDDLPSWDDLAGVDLHGPETLPTQAWSARVWHAAAAAGKITKCHAGEFDGPLRVREAIEVLGVRRIDHGTRAAGDPEVLALAADHGVVFDMCPASNVHLQVVADLAAFPLQAITAAGVPVTISTDDPLLFPETLTATHQALAAHLGLTPAESRDLLAAGHTAADITDSQREQWLADLTTAFRPTLT